MNFRRRQNEVKEYSKNEGGRQGERDGGGRRKGGREWEEEVSDWQKLCGWWEGAACLTP